MYTKRLKPGADEQGGAFDVDAATLRAMQEAREGIGIPLEEVVAWVESWDTDNELPQPVARKLY